MIRITLTPIQREEVQALRRDPTLKPVDRDRVEMVLLAAAGWAAPRIARHLSYHPNTVRSVLKDFVARRTAALRRKPPGPPPDVTRRQQVQAALRPLLAQARTWTAPQLADALRAHAIHLSTRQVRRYLRGLRAGYRRTVRTLRHKQDLVRVERATRTLTALKKRPVPGT
jgi:transposase